MGAATTVTPFLGREGDLRALLAVVDDAIDAGAARLVAVLGWPGLGKSRLAAELGARVRDRVTIVEARFVAGGASSFGPIAEALRRSVVERPTVALRAVQIAHSS